MPHLEHVVFVVLSVVHDSHFLFLCAHFRRTKLLVSTATVALSKRASYTFGKARANMERRISI